MKGLRKVDIEVPILGLNTRVSERALDPPATVRCADVEFTELGELTLRKPYTSLGTDIVGGGTIANLRRLATYNDELLLFTKENLYTYSEADSAWVERAEYLAPKVTENTVFARTTDQIECDRAELDGVIFYAWREDGGALYLAAVDSETRAVLYAPTNLTSGTNLTRPKLIALATKVLLFAVGSTTLYGKSLDPDSITTSAAVAWTSIATSSGGEYDVDVLKAGSAVVAMQDTTTTQYQVMSVAENLTVSNNTKLRTCDGPIAVAVAIDGNVAVLRANSTDIEGDILDNALADSGSTGVAVMTTSAASWNQIAAAFRSVQNDSQYRCYVFASSGETANDTDFITEYNWFDTGGTADTEATLVRRLGVASRAFDYNGEVYVWLAFAGDSATISTTTTQIAAVALQNTYFCYRADGVLMAKAAPAVAGGFSPTTGHLPYVQVSSGVYSWAGTERRRIPLESGNDYSDRGPRDITITFDSDEARRTVQSGRTLYLTGGQVMQFDGQSLVEVGFHIYPWVFDYNNTSGSIDYTKQYTYKVTWRWDNAQGERERSTSSAQLDADLTGAGADQTVSFSLVPLHTTLKQTARSEPAVEVWRTLGNPTVDAPLYLTTDLDPTNSTNPNRYLPNDYDAAAITLYDDDLVDASLDDRETFPEVGGVLESLAPPPATIVMANDDRVFLAGISYDADAVWYSKLRGQDEIAAFNDALVVRVPARGGAITALEFVNSTLVVFKETAIYALPGDGFDNVGSGQNYGPAQQISTDIGAVSAEAVAVTPEGLVFQSSKGWHLLDRGFGVQYIGAPVDEYDSDTWVAVHSVESAHQIRCLSSSRCLVYDTVAQQWSEWTLTGGKDAVFYDGVYTYLDATTAKSEASTYSGVNYGMDVELAWFKLDRLQGFGRVYDINVLGEYRSAHDLRIRLTRDYLSSTFQDKTWTVSPTTVGEPLQVRHGPSVQKVQALKVRLTAQAVGTTSAPSGEALMLTGIRFRVGLKRGGFRLPAVQKQ